MIPDIKRMKAMIDLLREDYIKSLELWREHSDPFWGRVTVRVFFALVEGQCYQWKQYVLAMYETFGDRIDVEFTPAEIAILREETYQLKDNGAAKSTTATIGTLPNVLFAFKIFARIHKVEFQLDIGGQGWEHFRSALKIRDKLTHPKSIDDFALTEKEAEIYGVGATWFDKSVIELFGMAEESLKKGLLRKPN